MFNTERKDFEDELAILFGGYPTFLTPPRVEAYWRGLERMTLSTFKRCVVETLGENGSDKLPTVNALWQLSKRLRAPAAPIPKMPSALPHPLQAAANGALLSLLRDKGPASEACMRKLVEVKNQIVGQLAGDSDPAEVRDVLIGAFEKHFVPMPEAEREAAISRRFGGAA